jgi:hypothetical protein
VVGKVIQIDQYDDDGYVTNKNKDRIKNCFYTVFTNNMDNKKLVIYINNRKSRIKAIFNRPSMDQLEYVESFLRTITTPTRPRKGLLASSRDGKVKLYYYTGNRHYLTMITI